MVLVKSLLPKHLATFLSNSDLSNLSNLSNFDTLKNLKSEKRLVFKCADGSSCVIASSDFKTLDIDVVGPLIHDMMTLFDEEKITISIPEDFESRISTETRQSGISTETLESGRLTETHQSGISTLNPIIRFLEGLSIDSDRMDERHVACYNLALGFMNLPGYARLVETTVATSIWSQMQSPDEIRSLFRDSPTIQSIVDVVVAIRSPMKFVDRAKLVTTVESSPMTWIVCNPFSRDQEQDVYRMHVVLNTSILGKEATEAIVSRIISRGMVDFHYEDFNPKNLPLLHCTAWLTPIIPTRNLKRCRESLNKPEFSLEDLLDSTEGWSINKDTLPRIDTVECALVHRPSLSKRNEFIFSKNHWWRSVFS